MIRTAQHSPISPAIVLSGIAGACCAAAAGGPTFSGTLGTPGFSGSYVAAMAAHDDGSLDLGRAHEGDDEERGAVLGHELMDAVEMVDQTPIGKSPRSNPVTYVKAFDPIRDLLSRTHQAKIRGYRAGTFSFNVPGGRCETCQGEGVVQVEMQFLADLYLECEACGGKRFKQDVLEIRWTGKNVDDILALTVDEAVQFFASEKRVANKLQGLQDVGVAFAAAQGCQVTVVDADLHEVSSWEREVVCSCDARSESTSVRNS